MQNPTTNKCLLILLLAAVAFNPLHFTVAANDKKLEAGAAPATWVGDLTPITNAEWNYDRVAHLLERAGFGGTPDEIKVLTPQEAVRPLVYFQNVKEAQLPPFAETGIFPSKTWSRDRMGAAFQAILFGTLDKLPPKQRRLMMADERTGVTAEDRRTALTDKQAVVDKFYYWRNVDLLETARLQTWLADRMLKTNRANDEYGFHPSLGGLKKLWDGGLVAVLHGYGYPNPDRSHFTSMEYWHTATPHQPHTTGWVGRFADSYWPQAPANTIVNITPKQSLAVQAERHSPVVFNNPEDFARAGDKLQSDAYRQLIAQRETGNAALDFLTAISRTASDSSLHVREVVRNYKTPVAYGSTPLALDLRKVAALVEARFPTRIYYVSLFGFDTHAGQQSGRFYLLTGLGESLRAFHEDLRRIRRSDEVAVMMFSEFGRCVEVNASAGTDHGTAGPMFVFGSRIKAGFHGTHPSLTDLDQNGDLKMTMDFRRVYATLMKEWMGFGDPRAILKGDFAPLGIFG